MSDVGAAYLHKGKCKAVVSGLLCGKPMKWEVVFDIEPFLNGREREEKVHEELWNETFHHLAGRSILHDFEHMVEKECEIEHGKIGAFTNMNRTFSKNTIQFNSNNFVNPRGELCAY